ncbi:MAG: hypothetical protein KTR15_10240 [Phycisphaeraceae bacterium]|nr:hypothetical protein [Phycisphaeraceae bacterium]
MILTALSALAVLLAALGMIGCSSTQAATSCSSKTACATTACSKAKFEQDRQAILGMAGQYDVTFSFEETMAIREGYELKKPYLEHASEMVVVVEDTGEHISMQHLLVVTHGEKTHVVKHWRQDWQYQTAEGYDFLGKNIWEPMAFSADALEGTWMQSVYQVDDSPRYWGVGAWEHRDGVSSWTAATNRPLPRREFSKRKDYQVLGAVNTHVVTPTGWMHYQHNHKIDKDNTDQSVIALEVGVNTYAKTTETDFSAAEEYWTNTQAYWTQVRAAWADVYGERETLHFKNKWKGDKMYAHIFELADEYWGEEDVSTARAKVEEVIDAFRQPEQVASP